MIPRVKRVFDRLSSSKLAVPIFLLLTSILITAQSILLGVNHFWGGNYTFYNNYIIFKTSFSHLVENKNLYNLYLNEHADLFRYSPTFAFFMFFFNCLPDSIGLFIWNSLNIFVFYYAIISIKMIGNREKLFLFLFVFLELVLSTQNTQSNVLLTGLIIITYNMFEKGSNTLASLFIAIGFFIKIYSGIGCLLIFLYPDKIKSILTLFVWGLLLLFLPLLVIGFQDLVLQYKNWFVLLETGQNTSFGMSIYLYMKAVISNPAIKPVTFIIGLLVLVSPLLLVKKHNDQIFRIRYLALLLIWIVVFNYNSESPTFIIAMTGVGLWYCIGNKSKINTNLLFLSLFFTSIWFTDLIPREWRNYAINPGYVKPFFPLIILLLIFINLIGKRRKEETV